MQDEPKKPDKAAVQTEEIAELITEDHVAKLLVVDRMKPSTICRVTGLSKAQLWGIRKDPQFPGSRLQALLLSRGTTDPPCDGVPRAVPRA